MKYSHNPGSLLKILGSVKKEGGQNGHWGTTISFCPRIIASPFALRYNAEIKISVNIPLHTMWEFLDQRLCASLFS